MNHICELNDQILLGTPGRSKATPRITARAILRRGDGLYALMYAAKFGLYSLPGGGVEPGEDVLTALHREILEETGCRCHTIRVLGTVTENRGSLDYTQISHYFLVETRDIPAETHLTEAEAANATRLQWHPCDSLCALISGFTPATIQQTYLRARDLAALDFYRKEYP